MPVTTTVEERQSLCVVVMALLLCSSWREVAWCELFTCCGGVSRRSWGVILARQKTYDLALIFLLLRLRRRTRFFLHLALIVNDWDC